MTRNKWQVISVVYSMACGNPCSATSLLRGEYLFKGDRYITCLFVHVCVEAARILPVSSRMAFGSFWSGTIVTHYYVPTMQYIVVPYLLDVSK